MSPFKLLEQSDDPYHEYFVSLPAYSGGLELRPASFWSSRSMSVGHENVRSSGRSAEARLGLDAT